MEELDHKGRKGKSCSFGAETETESETETETLHLLPHHDSHQNTPLVTHLLCIVYYVSIYLANTHTYTPQEHIATHVKDLLTHSAFSQGHRGTLKRPQKIVVRRDCKQCVAMPADLLDSSLLVCVCVCV